MVLTILELFLVVSFLIGTPGPANMLLMAGGARFGFKNCIGFIAGLVVGKFFLNMAIGLGLAGFITGNPSLNLGFKIISASYMIYLAILTWRAPAAQTSHAEILSFAKGLPVHPLNPKGWIMLILAWSEFGPRLGGLETRLLVLLLVFMIVQVIFHTLWCLGGAFLSRRFGESRFFIRLTTVLTIVVILYLLI